MQMHLQRPALSRARPGQHTNANSHLMEGMRQPSG